MLCSSAYLIPVPSPYRLGTYPAPRGRQLLFILSLLSVSPLLLCRLYCCTIVIVFLVTIVFRYVVTMPLLSCAL